MNKALVIGINKYQNVNNLTGCVNDANEISIMLSNNGDSSHNFDVKKLIDSAATNRVVLDAIKKLFENDVDVALLYFSGHGYDDKTDGAIVLVDGTIVKFQDLMSVVNRSRAKYKVIILDCCYAGKIASYNQIGDKTILSNNTVILTACSPSEPAIDDVPSKHGTFTKLLIGALDGGASDVLGRITAGSIYSYIDQALGSWQQRPYFKANVSSFAPIRFVKAKIDLQELKEGLGLFSQEDEKLKLNPSFEETNCKGNGMHKTCKPYAKIENVKSMKILQKMNQNGLVVPSNEQFMYYAAMKSDTIQLTNLGKHYWYLYKTNRI